MQHDEPQDVLSLTNKRLSCFSGFLRRETEILYFSAESFSNDWDPIRVDSALSLNNPIDIINVEFPEA
mgnify:CR=1 FL=1